jgi:O-antigen/teichoic acid export membrane protein
MFEREAARSVFRYVREATATYAFCSLCGRLDLYVLAWRGQAVELGLYAAGLTVASIPEILASYIAPLGLPRIRPACAAGRFQRIFHRYTTWAGIAWAAGAALSLVGGAWLLGGVLPQRYAASREIIAILLTGTLATSVLFMLTLHFIMLYRPKVPMIVDALALPGAVAAMLFAAGHGGVAMAWTTAAIRIVKGIATQWYAWRLATKVGGSPQEVKPAAEPSSVEL